MPKHSQEHVQRGLSLEDGSARLVIYIVRCIPTNRCYVGQTAGPLRRRWLAHIRDASNPHKTYRSLLHDAIKKYGVENFSVGILENCKSSSELDSAEQWWIAVLGTCPPSLGFGYNLDSGGRVGKHFSGEMREAMNIARKNTTYVASAETRLKMSLSRIGLKRTPEQCAAQSARMLGIKRGPHTSETKAKMAAAHTGIPLSVLHKIRLSESHTGIKHTMATRHTMAIKATGRKHTPEQRAARSNWQRGKKASTSAIENMRLAWLARKSNTIGRLLLAGAESGHGYDTISDKELANGN